MKIETKKKSWLINNRYEIYKSDGVVYDTKEAKDIPQEIFELRDKLMFTRKQFADYGRIGGKKTLKLYGKKHMSKMGKIKKKRKRGA